MECSIEGCIRPIFSGGLCCKHYDEWKLAKAPICSVDGCITHSHAKGLCNKHYRQEVQKEKPECIVEGCGRPQHTKSLCNTHYRRKLKYGHLDPTRPADWGAMQKHPLYHAYKGMMKKGGHVIICQSWKDDFQSFVKDMGDKPDPRCTLKRDSESLPYNKSNCYWKIPVRDRVFAESKAEYQRKYIQKMRDDDPDRFHDYDFKRNFGISLKKYNEMLDDQNDVCAICNNKEIAKNPVTGEIRRFAVDHCHKTGKIRGLLCTKCNMILGGANDSIDIFKAAIQYLT